VYPFSRLRMRLPRQRVTESGRLPTCPHVVKAAADLIASRKVDTMNPSPPDCCPSLEGQPPCGCSATSRGGAQFCWPRVYTDCPPGANGKNRRCLPNTTTDSENNRFALPLTRICHCCPKTSHPIITVVILSRGDNRYVVTAWPEIET
jgi:hypothetical protein